MSTTLAPSVTDVTVTVGDADITMETGKLAKQADGAVLVRSGDTMILATAQNRTEAREGCSSRSPWTWRSGCTPRARSPAASSSARGARPRRRS